MGQIANQMLANFITSIGNKIKEKKAEKAQKPLYNFDPENERPVIRASICNGEQIAGFKNIHTGEFHEVMLIKNDDDKAAFMRSYGLEKVEKEY